MKKILLAIMLASLTSCVLVVGDDDAHIDYDNHSDYSSNNELADRVEDVIYADESIRIQDLQVSSKNRVVYLRGKTKDPQAVTRAVSLAMADSEVESVTSRIVVHSSKY